MEDVKDLVDPILDVPASIPADTEVTVQVNLTGPDPHEEYLNAVKSAEDIRMNRPVNEIPLNDDYWEARNKATALFNSVKK